MNRLELLKTDKSVDKLKCVNINNNNNDNHVFR